MDQSQNLPKQPDVISTNRPQQLPVVGIENDFRRLNLEEKVENIVPITAKPITGTHIF